ncbi:MAG TPA: DUF1553 domain-containing protein, partial [Pirellulaceae bacterium]|nr:DUF1553 domain-containing protein [Pirellulaceae bacterium]
EGGVQDKEYLAKYIAERVRNLSGAWLGVTLGCCECHNHKYDPFTARDFYSLEAFFADIKEQGLYSGSHASGVWGPNIKVPSPEQTQQLAALDQRLAALKQKLETPTPELAAAQLEWEKTQVAWTLLKPAQSPQATEGVKLTVKDDGSILAGGPNAKTTTYTVVIADPPPGITALRVEVLPDDSLPKKGPGRAGNGNFVLTEFKAQLKPAGDGAAQSLALQNASATYEQTGASNGNPYGKWAVAAAIDGDAKGAGWGWAVMEKVGQAHSAVFETTGELPGGPGSQLTLTLDQLHENPTHTIGRFRLWATTSARPVRADHGASPAIAAFLATPRDQRTAAQNDELAKHFRTIAPALEPLRAELKKLEQDRTALDAQIPTTLVTVSVPPRTIRILARGNWMDETGEIVQPGFPAVLTAGGSTSATATAPAVSASPGTGAAPGAPAAPARLTRLDLARWVVSPENPLTARTFVNRVWKLYFGAGLPRKLDDLGAQGEWPSHPLLLDYLAGRFVDSGWDVKQLVKTIVMSETYRQSSDEPAALREVDPFNKLLARQSRYRLDAELVRDNALRVSGLLVERVGGASVKPYQPPGYWAYLNFPQREWQNGTGDELYRRGLYTHWQRQYLHPSLLAFDAPCREECAADRPRSNTPLQSLVLLNDPTYVEAARALAVRVLKEGGDSSEKRLEWLFRRALSRSIRSAERTVLDKLLASHLADYRADAAAAKELLTVGAYAAPAELDAAELAAWTSVCRSVLSVHEFITRY